MLLTMSFHQFIDEIIAVFVRFYNLILNIIIPFLINNYFFRLMLILIVLSIMTAIVFNILDIGTTGFFDFSDDYSPRHGPRHSDGYVNSVYKNKEVSLGEHAEKSDK